MGASESFERYTNATIDQAVFMEMFGEVGRVTSITIGSRFERIIIMRLFWVIALAAAFAAQGNTQPPSAAFAINV